MITLTSRLTSTLAALALATALGCGGLPEDPATLTTPRSALPASVAGRWFTGTLSSLEFYDTSSHTWLDRGGSGFYYVFGEDGSYETGAVIDSTVGGCTLRLLGQEIGTVTIDGGAMTAYRAWVRTHATNTCGNAGDNEDGEATTAMTFEVGRDEYGEVLSITNDYGTTRYHRWKE